MTKNPIYHAENFAYDKLFPNNLVISKISKGNDMNKENCSFLETEQNGMTITFVFPPKTQKEEDTTSEIKNILTSILKQYLTREV